MRLALHSEETKGFGAGWTHVSVGTFIKEPGLKCLGDAYVNAGFSRLTVV